MDTKKPTRPQDHAPMTDVFSTRLARPMDRNAMSNDARTLEVLAAEMNNPALTGAVVPPEERRPPTAPPRPVVPEPERRPVQEVRLVTPANQPRPPERVQQGQPIPAPMPPSRPEEFFTAAPAVAPATAPIVLPASHNKIFFTGFSRVGKSHLAALAGARVLELNDPIIAMGKSSFGDTRPGDLDAFESEVFAWGEGIVSPQFPLTASRAVFIETIRSVKGSDVFQIPFESFGTAGFWVNSLIARATRFLVDFPTERVVVTGVYTPDQYTALRTAGFIPFHVTCNSLTRQARGGAGPVSQLADMVERDLTNKISQDPRGRKLWAIWSDDKYQTPSARYLTTEEFLASL